MLKGIFSWILALFLLVSMVTAAGVTEDIPISKGIAASTTYAFTWSLDDSDLPNFMDTQIDFQGQNYDVHDELVFITSSPSIETSLTSRDDNYESDVFMEVKKKSIYYVLFFDENNMNVSKATSDEPLVVDFLGEKLRIIDADFVEDNENKFKLLLGDEYFMEIGDVVTVDGKMVVLKDVGADGSVLVNVNGIISVVPASTVKEINGIEVLNKGTFYNPDKFERAAILYINDVVVATYVDGDPYIGENELSPGWKWWIGNLANGAQSATALEQDAEGFISASVDSGPYIGIYNYFRRISSNDNPAGVGECYYLPNNYAEICLDSLSTEGDVYWPMNIEYIEVMDMVHIYTPISENVLVVPPYPTIESNLTINTYTNEVWLQMLNENEVGIFYDANEGMPGTYIGSIDISIEEKEFLRMDYQDTTDNNIIFKASKETIMVEETPGFFVSKDIVKIKLDINGDSTDELEDEADDLITTWLIEPDIEGNETCLPGECDYKFSSFGLIKGVSESDELIWSHKYINWEGVETLDLVEIGKKDEDHRSIYGIIIKDPNSNSINNRVILRIPGDQVQANVVINSNYVPPGPEEPQTIYDINLDVGWNLFSIPLTQADTITENVVSGIKDKIDVIYGYEQGQWEVWRDGFAGNTLTNLEAGKGYFIKLIEPVSLHIEGSISIGEPPELPEFNVYQGWNLIGYYGTKDVAVFKGLRNVDEKYSAIWSLFKNNIQSLQGNLRGMDFDEPLIRTHGYWLYMQEDGVIVPTD